jgi:hypothetical protein
MTIAEKFYRKSYKVKDGVKLTPEQWKVVNMMHRCLQEYNKPKLPHGSILVNKKALVEHLSNVKKCLNATDKLMDKPEYRNFATGTGGKELAKIWNALNLTMQSVLKFQLDVPTERLCEEINDLNLISPDNDNGN